MVSLPFAKAKVPEISSPLDFYLEEQLGRTALVAAGAIEDPDYAVAQSLLPNAPWADERLENIKWILGTIGIVYQDLLACKADNGAYLKRLLSDKQNFTADPEFESRASVQADLLYTGMAVLRWERKMRADYDVGYDTAQKLYVCRGATLALTESVGKKPVKLIARDMDYANYPLTDIAKQKWL